MRISFGKTKKVELMVQIENDSEKARTLSCDILLGNGIAFERSGLSNTKVLRLGKMKSGEKTVKYFDVFPRPMVKKGEQPIFISVLEHFEERYEYILSKKTKQLSLRIE